MCPERWVVATRNPHKLEELRAIIKYTLSIELLPEGFPPIEEPFSTLDANAWAKAHKAWHLLKKPVFAEDTGLEIDALGGKPGVHTARYGGEDLTISQRRQLVLKQMKGITNRKARFRTVLVAIIDGVPHFFEGVVEGRIAEVESGHGGFGYDPIFIPDGYEQTFAELPAEVKNEFSHRARAVKKFLKFCRSIS
ncbi:MAG: RdgB/HAM1 family non-canonical purine NTP pyrophosphatase [Chlorobi bacterium]|nr:RdgB/HAM1 family non-canonical purine NTP pyrophosphatase [Chlorobiota bacterium]